MSSFIWSHIHNILETKSPVKQHLKELVLKTGFEKRDYQNPTKFSQNYETSAFSDKYNLGSTGDANVIFTPESFLPRSASINLTVDLFGSAFNVLEVCKVFTSLNVEIILLKYCSRRNYHCSQVDTRVVNLERFLESYVGPSGKLRQHNVQELASKFHDRWHGIAEDIEKEATEHDHSKHKRELPYSPQKLNRHRTRVSIMPEIKSNFTGW